MRLHYLENARKDRLDNGVIWKRARVLRRHEI